MAFTDTQRAQIVLYMGYPALAAGTRYAAFYPFYSQIDLIGGDPVEQAQVEAMLTELAAIDLIVGQSTGASINFAGLKKADEAEFYSAKDSLLTPSEIMTPVKRGRMVIKRLARKLGGEKFIAGDYFGGGRSSASIDVSLG